MAAVAAKTILLVLSVAFTIAATAVAHPLPPSSETLLVKKCTEALGEKGTPLVTFCAGDLLAHRAAFLASCDRRKTVAVVVKEARMRAKVFEDLEKKIVSDKSLSGNEVQDLESCWRITNKFVTSMGSTYTNNFTVNESSLGAVLKAVHERKKMAKGVCHFTAARRQSGVWLELKKAAEESLLAQTVALSFVNHLNTITNN